MQLPGINFVVLKKPGERFVVVFRDDQRGEAISVVERWASNPSLSFNWSDAVNLASEIRRDDP